MNFDLTGLWNGRTNNLTSTPTENNIVNESNRQITESGSRLAIGNILSGQITCAENGVTQIELSTGESLLAKLDDGITFSTGANVTFEVSGISDSQVVLKALFQNTTNINTINKALSEAGIEQNGVSISMVNTMMEDGMPIDRASIQNMYRQVLDHPEIESTAIVTMNHLKIEPTQENVRQFCAYMNLEHQISTSVELVTQAINDTYLELVDKDDDKAFQFMKQIVDLLSSELPEEELIKYQYNTDLQQNIDFQQNIDNINLSQTLKHILLQTMDSNQLNSILEDPLNNQQTSNTVKVFQQPNTLDPLIGKRATVLSKEMTLSIEKSNSTGLTEQAELIEQTQEELLARKQMLRDLSTIGLPKDMQSSILDGHISDKEILDYVRTVLDSDKMQEHGVFEKALKLFSTKGFQKLIQEQVRKQWLLDPRNVESHQGIEEFYTRLKEQTGKLANNLSNIIKQNSELYKEITNIHENVDFMNQLNQTANYVQLPLRFHGDATHGDLYVYKNKKLNDNDGSVSAYLHLDMENLGPVDVFVALKDSKLNTNFYLKDDSMIDFIEENITLLNDRLEKKGFQVNTNISIKEKKVNIMKEIVTDHKQDYTLSKQSFDMRA